MTRFRKDVTVITQFYPPETGATQTRISALARALSEAGANVTVLTGVPNYPTGRVAVEYRGRWYAEEQDGAIRVLRVWLWAQPSRRAFDRVLGYASFGITSLLAGLFKSGKSEIIICESAPLFLGITAWLLARAKSALLVVNVSDLWTDSMIDLGILKNGVLASVLRSFDRFAYRAADMVSGQTRHVVARIGQISPDTRVYLWRTGANPVEVEPGRCDDNGWRKRWKIPRDAFVVGYAGHFGSAQDLVTIVDAAAELKDTDIRFVLVGEGPQRDDLEARVRRSQFRNVILEQLVPHGAIDGVWDSFDCAVVSLKRGSVFRGAIPCKLYEAMAHGVPVVLGIEGEAAEIIQTSGAGVVVQPEDSKRLAQAIVRLRDMGSDRRELGKLGRAAVKANYDRRLLCAKFAREILSLARD